MRYLKFLLPLILVAALDLLFQLGAWEPVASPESYAGTSVLRKRAIEDPAYAHVDFVTLGSSRPVYGIDHTEVAHAASAHGYTYADLSIPGVHWMTVGLLTDWLSRHHPEIRGGVIALSVQDFLAPGNGAYEIGLAYPFRSLADIGSMSEHVAFDWHNPATYGLYSGLFAYHEDVENLLAHPRDRSKVLRYFRALTPQQVLTGNAEASSDMCASRIEHLDDCRSLDRFVPKPHPRLESQCKQLQGTASGRYDLRPFLGGRPLTERLRQARDLIRAELRNLRWPIPPVVVLMPMPSVWATDAIPPGAHEWALSVLEPLVADNTIRVLDYTDMFRGSNECSAFFDLYHNNAVGRQQVMARLLPEIERDLFANEPHRNDVAALPRTR